MEHVNRVKGLLFAQGVSDYEPLKRNRRARLEGLKTGDGRPLPCTWQVHEPCRELDRLELLLEPLKAVEADGNPARAGEWGSRRRPCWCS